MVCCAALRGAALSLGPLLCLPSAVPAAMAHPLPSTKLANQLCRWSDDCPETWGHDNHLCCASSNPPIRAVFSPTNCRWSDDYPKTWEPENHPSLVPTLRRSLLNQLCRWSDDYPETWEPEEHVSPDLIRLWEEQQQQVGA